MLCASQMMFGIRKAEENKWDTKYENQQPEKKNDHTLIHTPDTLIPHTHITNTYCHIYSLRFMHSVTLLRVFPTGGDGGDPPKFCCPPIIFWKPCLPPNPLPSTGRGIPPQPCAKLRPRWKFGKFKPENMLQFLPDAGGTLFLPLVP